MTPGETLTVTVKLVNHGDRGGDEVVQLYTRDLVGSVTRPVRELKDFQKVSVPAHSEREVTFELPSTALGFYGRRDRWAVEPGEFEVWVGGDSSASLGARFEIVESKGSQGEGSS